MPYKRIIVMTTYHLGADDLWDICKLSVVEHSLDVILDLWKARSSECYCFFVFVLKFGQLQSHASDVSNVKTVSSDRSLEGVPKSVELGQDSCFEYQNLVERRQVTRVKCKARYFGQRGLQVVQVLDVLGAEDLFLFCTLLRVSK